MTKQIVVLGILIGLCAFVSFAQGQSTTTPPPTPADWFECPQINGYFPHPYDCQKYFVCVNYNAWLLRCPANLYFDSVRELCDFPDNVVCNAVPTGFAKVQ